MEALDLESDETEYGDEDEYFCSVWEKRLIQGQIKGQKYAPYQFTDETPEEKDLLSFLTNPSNVCPAWLPMLPE